eukprot:CAMPEP_0195292772 /NCGR_PEP_ID=MMETSP0707-20130614/10815_1 /TAXON_ID=33640 /ORGANISM="Asterionellopsis glacialis, Strain CCMP134" /LENGTH=633 /DNA_ID=CAMNT_0040353337 /DNA_START=352 /DNA_END=2253 /DNA_ORIENTATION=-
MEIMYDSPGLAEAYQAYDAAEKEAFQKSCTDIPENGIPTEYNCLVKIDADILENFETACISAGGVLKGVPETPKGIECCGEINGNFVIYGYTSAHRRTCIAGCSSYEEKRFQPQGMFQAGTTKFQDELGLRCGVGCEDRKEHTPGPSSSDRDPSTPKAICHGYITGSDSYIANGEAKPIPCDGKFGDEVFPSFQDLSCCSDEGRYFVHSGQIGGFDAGYDTTITDPACIAYAEALSAVLCNPRQGYFISTDTNVNVLRICRSSCDQMFDICGFPGENFPRWAGYSDGTSLCYDLFGGFGTSPCESRPSGYPCKAGLTIEVVDEDCLSITEPYLDKVNEYGDVPTDSTCFDFDSEATVGETIVGLVVLVCICVSCWGGCYCIYSRCGRKNSPPPPIPTAAPGATLATSTATATATMSTTTTTTTPATAAAAAAGYGNRIEESPVYVSATIKQDSARPGSEAEPASVTVTAIPVATTSNQETNYSVMPPPTNPSFQTSTPPVIAPVLDTVPVIPLAQVVEEAELHRQEEVVQSWISEHPDKAAALRPEDVADVLSKVSFSLQKTSIAKVLASGMHNTNSLTCAHVVAAMDACRFDKTEVAKSMAPYVNDPHKKDDVLNALDLSFERTSVSMCFAQ